ncbi:hypothetical protein KKH36_03770 [Patescibacteria group bacterium]|nr:hypothetical protein [Patescibacteria group bacterium]
MDLNEQLQELIKEAGLGSEKEAIGKAFSFTFQNPNKKEIRISGTILGFQITSRPDSILDFKITDVDSDDNKTHFFTLLTTTFPTAEMDKKELALKITFYSSNYGGWKSSWEIMYPPNEEYRRTIERNTPNRWKKIEGRFELL